MSLSIYWTSCSPRLFPPPRETLHFPYPVGMLRLFANGVQCRTVLPIVFGMFGHEALFFTTKAFQWEARRIQRGHNCWLTVLHDSF